jgi:hypothetical protein
MREKTMSGNDDDMVARPGVRGDLADLLVRTLRDLKDARDERHVYRAWFGAALDKLHELYREMERLRREVVRLRQEIARLRAEESAAA